MADEAPQVRYAALHTPAGCATSCARAALRPPGGAQPAERWTLWLKRTDVEAAQYASVKGVDVLQTIDDFKAGWLNVKKLDVDPSLVSLRLVRSGLGKPNAEEEATALLPAALLDDPRLTLREARIADGSSLLACFAAAPATSSPPRPRFVRLLQEAHITRPDVAVLQLAERHFPSAVLAVFDAAGAADLYERCKQLPGTPTRIQVREATGVTLNGPLSGPDGAVLANILSGTGPLGEPLVAKLLYGGADVALEREMCDTLQLAPWDDEASHPHSLVRASVVTVEPLDLHGIRAVRRHEAVSALLMPRYPACLAGLPQLSCDAIVRGAQQLVSALAFLHDVRPDAPWVHMDVKAANVMVDARGNWLLADFGSCTPRDAHVRSCTEQFLPPGPEQRHALRARVEYDYDMLLVLLVIEVHKSDWKAVLYDDGVARVSRPRLQAATDHLLESAAFIGAPAALRTSFAACVHGVRKSSTLA